MRARLPIRRWLISARAPRPVTIARTLGCAGRTVRLCARSDAGPRPHLAINAIAVGNAHEHAREASA